MTQESSSDRARSDARRAARAVRLARGKAATPAAPVEDDEVVESVEPVDVVDAPGVVEAAEVVDSPEAEDVPAAEPVSLTKAAPAVVEDAGNDDGSDDASESEDESDPAVEVAEEADEPARTRRRPRPVTVAATVFALLAVVFMVIATIVYTHAQDDRSSSPAAARDAALLAARQEIVVLNTLDYTDVEGGLQRWLGATTGTLHDQLSNISDADKQAIAVSKSVTTASVLAAAVTQVDPTHGGATVIASLQIDVKPATGQASSKRNRFSLTMQRVGDVWKISAIQQLPVTLT